MTPFLSNCHATDPGSANDPPFFDNVDLTSEPVLFLLSVSVSIYSATPLGA